MNVPGARSIFLNVLAIGLCSISLFAEQQKEFVPQVLAEALTEGNRAFTAKDYPTARSAYEKALAVDPDNLVALVNLGMAEFQSGNNAKARELLEKAVRLRLETAPAWLTLGIIHMDADRFPEALAALSQAALLDPENPRVHNFLGVVIGRHGWIDGAQQELRRAVELDPAYADAHYNLAAFYLEEKPPAVELARRHYFKALELGVEKDAAMEKVLQSSKPKP
ncbi:MAG: tetratricopeptide repeat protein [Verrucomicrobiota bacterium]